MKPRSRLLIRNVKRCLVASLALLITFELKANTISDYYLDGGLLHIQVSGTRDWYLSDGTSPPTWGSVDLGQAIPTGATPGLVHESLLGTFSQSVQDVTVTIQEWGQDVTSFIPGLVNSFDFNAQDMVVPGLGFQSASFTLMPASGNSSVPDSPSTFTLLLLGLSTLFLLRTRCTLASVLSSRGI